jgi:hypothetical protein
MEGDGCEVLPSSDPFVVRKLMKILFLGRHFTYFRNFESVLRELASRGHQLQLAVEQDESLGGTKLVRSLIDEFPNVTAGLLPDRPEDDWTWAATRLRLGLDYLRYQHPVFDRAYKLRERSRGRTPAGFVMLGDVVRSAGGWTRRGAEAVLRRLERAIPETSCIRDFVAAHKPDVVLLTPLIDLGSSQIDYLRAARALGIPTALCVWSWDHLSSKALIRECPDRVFVWNATQKGEAIELHRVPADRVIVTGAQCFDHWFERAPSRTREQFCAQIGVDPHRPFILWVCSALIHGSPPEAPFVVEWIRRLRASGDPSLRGAGVVVRPHPSRVTEWDSIDVSQLDAVVWGSNPIDETARVDYFDSIVHSAAVVGLNTSAFIEAGIVGRPVLTIVVPEFEENQHGTVHFDYLVKAGGGLVVVGEGFERHLEQLASALAAPPAAERRPFVRDFVRPLGLDRAATPMFVQAVEAMQGLQVEQVHPDALAPVWRWVLRRAATLKDNERFERWTLSPREQVTAERRRVMREQKAIRRALSRAANDANRQRKLQEREARLAAGKQQRLEARRRAAAERKAAAVQPSEQVR